VQEGQWATGSATALPIGMAVRRPPFALARRMLG
jgi:hypothetical protein